MSGATTGRVTRGLRTLTLALVAAGAFALGAGTARADAGRSRLPAVRVAQAPSDAVTVAAGVVARAEKSRATIVAQRTALDQRYATELGEIDKLKRQKASWRRDRALRSKLAASVETARALAALASQVAAAEAELARARARGVAAIDGALATASADRRPALLARRQQWAPAARVKRIVIPDDALDPLADPEELDDQVAALVDSEAELAREVARLDGQAGRFDRLAALRRQHDRAEELATRDDVDPRPGVAGPSRFAGAVDAAPAPSEESGFDAPERDAAALSAVIDAGTSDALRSAERSNEPARRALATRAARDAVAARLARLRQQRAAIEARARALRRAP